MCRLLGFVADRRVTARGVLGEPDFGRFTSLATVHGDGWGTAGVNGTGLRVRTSPASAAVDPGYVAATSETPTEAGLVHLRWATDGLAVAPQNSHPFTDGRLALAHNGCIAPLERLEGLLSPSGRAQLRGDTDSERYYQFVKDRIRLAGDDVSAGLVAAVDILAEEFPNASLNAMLLSESALHVVHVNSSAEAPLEDLRTLFPDDTMIPAGHLTTYFQMSIRRSGGTVAVVSSGLAGDGWQPVPDNSVLRIDRAGQTATYLR